MHASHANRPAPRPAPGRRIEALDGLRGLAAAVVVVFHYMCVFHHQLLPHWSEAAPALSFTPLAILFNGPFAVSVFFVLSGFVIAAAAERRRASLLANVVTRYLRLALPVTASVVLAWALLSLMPDAALRLEAAQADPSPWLAFSYRGEVPGLLLAIADGFLGNFLRGGSNFNNALWTMQIELVGSVLLFVAYRATAGRPRLWLLAGAGLVILLVFRDAYLAFVTGALLHEGHRRGLLAHVPGWAAALALAAGVVLGAPGPGVEAWLHLPPLPEALRPGDPEGPWPVLAATLLLLAVLRLAVLARLLRAPPMLWLGRISFGLYLVHVPPLYTLVAAAAAGGMVAMPALAVAYFAGVLGLAHVFTRAVEAPVLQTLSRLRGSLAGDTRHRAARQHHGG